MSDTVRKQKRILQIGSQQRASTPWPQFKRVCELVRNGYIGTVELVEAVDKLGVFVSEIVPRNLLHAYEIREMFEGLAARLCCERASRADVGQFRDLANRIHELGRNEQRAEMGAFDRRFHHAMIVVSANPVLQRLTEGYRVLGMAVQAERDIEQILDEHLAIVAAIEANRPNEAEQLARRHVREARAALESRMETGPFAPRWVTGDPDET